MVGLEQPQALSFPLQNASTRWPKGGNFQHLCGWHPCNASCFHYGELSVSAWDIVTLTTVVWGYHQLSLSLLPLLSLSLWLASSWCNYFLPLYFSSWILFIVSFTFVDGIFPEVKERKLCPCLWEKEKDSPNLTPRAYSPRAAVFVRTLWRHNRIREWQYQHWEEYCWALVCNYCLPSTFLAHAVPRSVHWCPRQSPLPRLQKTFSDSTRLHKSEPQGTNPSYGCRVKSLWDLSEWG